MYIIQNAWKSITRNKARNILIGIVALVIAVSSCVALSIRQAAETAKQETLKDMSITGQITFDRSSQMSSQRSDMKNNGGFNKENFDFKSMSGQSLTLDDYMKYTQAQSDGDSYYYTITSSLNASGDLEAYSSSGSSSTSSSSDSTGTNGNSSASMPGGGMMTNGDNKSFSAKGDFSLVGYSSYQGLMTLFGNDGTCTISDGSIFDESTSDAECVISDELAMYNNLSVGDTITLENPNYESETYTLTICGIYTNSSSNQGSSSFARTDPANNIYLSYNSLKAITDASSATGNTTDSKSAALTNELAFTYVFSSVDHYNSFKSGVSELGLSDSYTVTSTDLTAYENSLTPLETLSTMAGWFFLIVLGIGGIILIVLNIFNLRERKYEVGVLTAIGMKKHKVATQFICELFTITFTAILLGAIIGAIASVPITNVLLANQAKSTESTTQQVSSNFGKDMSGASGSSSSVTGSSTNTSGGAGSGMPSGEIPSGGMGNSSMITGTVSYITSVSSATNIVVILELVGVGLFLTILSSLAAMITIMRYEPLKILSSRS